MLSFCSVEALCNLHSLPPLDRATWLRLWEPSDAPHAIILPAQKSQSCVLQPTPTTPWDSVPGSALFLKPAFTFKTRAGLVMVIATFVLAISFFLSSILPLSIAQQVRRQVVDDSDPAISYVVGTVDGQSGQWEAMDTTQQATFCAAANCWNVLDTSQLYGGTWHQGYGPVTISYTFNGTGVAAYFVSSNQSGSITNISFFIDGQLSQAFGGAINGMDGSLSYGVQLFAVSDLPDQPHDLVISQNGGSSPMMFDYLTYDEVATDEPTSDGLSPSTATAAAVQASAAPVDPLRVPASHGTARSAVGAAVASVLIGTLFLVVAVQLFLRVRKRESLAKLPSKYDTDEEAPPVVITPYQPPPSDILSSRDQHSRPDRTTFQYAESTTEATSDESNATQPEQPDRRSRFRSAVSTVVAALTPCQITSFSRVELRTVLAALVHPALQQPHGVQHNTHTDKLEQRLTSEPKYSQSVVPVIDQAGSPQTLNASLASITASPSLRSVSSASSTFRSPSVPPTAPLRLPRSFDQYSPPSLPRFTFEERRHCRPDTIMDPEVLQNQIQALLWNAPPLPNRARTPSAPPPYVSRPSTPRASLASRRTTVPPSVGPDGIALPLPPLPPVPPLPEKVAIRI